LDCSYCGLFVPWTVRTLLDCSYHGLFVPSLYDSYRDARLTKLNVSYQNVSVFSVSQTPLNFSDIFPNAWGFLEQILLSDYTFLSTLDYKFLFNYLQLTKLCHIKRDHHHMLEMSTIGQNARRRVRTVHGTNSPGYEKSKDGTNSPWYKVRTVQEDTNSPRYEQSKVQIVHRWYE